MQRLESLQVLRAFAALVVVFFHAIHLPEYRGDDFWFRHHGGWRASLAYGVEVFFVISGFIVSTVATRENSPFEFFVKRVWKVIPLYYAMTAYQYWFLWDEGKTPTLERLWRSLLFVRQNGGPVLVAGWTLNYEMVFYLAVTLLILFRARPLAWWAAAAMLALAWNWLPYYLLFAAGCVLGELTKRITLPNWSGAMMIAASVAFFAWRAGQGDAFGEAFNWDKEHGNVWWRLSRSGPYAVLLVAGTVLPAWRNARMPRWLVFLGDASYPIYICQQLGLIFASRKFYWLPTHLYMLSGVLSCTLLGCFVHLVWERPFAKTWKRVYDWFPALRPSSGSHSPGLSRALPATAPLDRPVAHSGSHANSG
jgi:exopolysaccharide production protein ExoZ